MSTSSSNAVAGAEERCCAYCGRLRRRCACDAPESAIRRFFERGGRAYQPLSREGAYKRGVPPRIKLRHRRDLKKRYATFYRALCKRDGERCANCDETQNLALDHIVPIAKGGASTLDNLQLLCATCNQIKGKLAIDCRGLRHPK